MINTSLWRQQRNRNRSEYRKEKTERIGVVRRNTGYGKRYVAEVMQKQIKKYIRE